MLDEIARKRQEAERDAVETLARAEKPIAARGKRNTGTSGAIRT